jgi:hypothetical protein
MRGKLGLAFALGALVACARIGLEAVTPAASHEEVAAVTTGTKLSRPPIDLVETPGIETATFALG